MSKFFDETFFHIGRKFPRFMKLKDPQIWENLNMVYYSVLSSQTRDYTLPAHQDEGQNGIHGHETQHRHRHKHQLARGDHGR